MDKVFSRREVFEPEARKNEQYGEKIQLVIFWYKFKKNTTLIRTLKYITISALTLSLVSFARFPMKVFCF